MGRLKAASISDWVGVVVCGYLSVRSFMEGHLIGGVALACVTIWFLLWIFRSFKKKKTSADLKTCVIKKECSIIGDFSSVQDWQGKGPYTTEITMPGLSKKMMQTFQKDLGKMGLCPASYTVLDEDTIRIERGSNEDLHVHIVE